MTHTYSVRFPWRRDHLVARYLQDKITRAPPPHPGGIQTRNPRNQAAADIRLGTRGYRDRLPGTLRHETSRRKHESGLEVHCQAHEVRASRDTQSGP